MIRRLVAVAATLIGCVSGTAFAQAWQGLGPEGGAVHFLLADPFVAGRVYAVGAAGLFRSEDAGRHWRSLGADVVPVNDIPKPRAVIVDRYHPGRLYLITYDWRLWRSDDSAEHWTPGAYTVTTSFPPDQPYVHLVDVPGSGDSLLFAGPDGYLQRSTDGGASFTRVALLDKVTAIAVDPANPATVLIGRRSTATSPTEIWRSGNGGESWTRLLGFGDHPLRSLQFLGDGRIAAIYRNNVAISSDGGLSWQSRTEAGYPTLLEILPGQPPVWMTHEGATSCRLSIDEFVSSTPCIDGLGAGPAGFYSSTLAGTRDGAGYRFLADAWSVGIRAYDDASGRWQPSISGFRGIRTQGLVVLPGSGLLLAGRADEMTLGSRIVRTGDGGANWNDGFPPPAELITDIQFDPTTTGLPSSPHLYAAGLGTRRLRPYNSGIYKSTDGGQSWQSLDGGLPPHSNGGPDMSSTNKVLLDPRSCATPPPNGVCTRGPLLRLYATSFSAAGAAWSVLRSDDAGASWIGVGSALPRGAMTATGYETRRTFDIALDAGSETLYVSTVADWESEDPAVPYYPTLPNGVFVSDNRGTTWAHRSAGLPLIPGSATTHYNVWALATHPRRGGTLWAAVHAPGQATQIFKSTDKAVSWSPAGLPLTGCKILALQVDTAAPDVIYAAGYATDQRPGCVWRSEDGGASWTALDANLPLRRIHRLRQHPDDRRRLILSSDRGVWEASLPSDRIFDDRGS
ncbi:WD40/YVTN/BNR-like repeat-containing protein [Tahibacter caeni]|uniref:WD40/YVTN/BNR-like repeat-containing protein n=1 Tax=Tahibacter caeni TaxID=1453545 RepID=UPI0021485DD4|nr:hypothetical protein [Tahibacter caeni]